MITTQFSSNNKIETPQYFGKLATIEASFVIIISDKKFIADTEISTIIREKSGKIPMIGCFTAGEIVGEELSSNSFVINSIKFKYTC